MAMQQVQEELNFDTQTHNMYKLRGRGMLNNLNGEPQRRLEEVAYWRKRAGWYDDAVDPSDDFVPSSSSSNGSSTRSSSFGSAGQHSLIAKIVGGVALFVVMVVLAKQFAGIGGSRSETDRGRKSSSSKSRSRSKSRTRDTGSSRSRSRSKARNNDGMKRSRSRSRSKKRVTDEYNLMEENSSKASNPPINKMLV